MIDYPVRAHRSEERLARNDELAWRIAEVAHDRVEVDDDVVDMVINRVIDDAAVAVAALSRRSVAAARDQAVRHPYRAGATVLGLDAAVRVSPEWAA